MVVEYFKNISFAQPLFFGLLLLLPLLIAWHIKTFRQQSGSLKVSSAKSFEGLISWKNNIQHLPFVLRLFAITLFIIALARPQIKTDEQKAEGEGIDIVLCIDVSGSMTAQDFTPNRMEAAKKVAADFVDQRLTDRIGIVILDRKSTRLNSSHRH